MEKSKSQSEVRKAKLPKVKLKGEKGQYGETLRPSEREDTYVPTQDNAEGLRSQTSDTSRR